MAIFDLELPDKRILTLEAPDPETAMSAATSWHQANPVESNPAAGVMKSAGVGLGNAAIGMLGAGGDARNLTELAASKLAGLVGASPETAGMIGKGAATVTSALNPFMQGLTSAQIKGPVEGVTGPFYKPQNAGEELAQKAGEFLPSALMGPGGVARRLLAGVAAPALGATAAGQAADKYLAPELRPWAELTGGILAGAPFAGPRVSGAPTIEQVLKSAEAGYKSPEVGGVIFKPGAIDSLVSSITSSLQRAKANERLAPQTAAIVDDLKQPVNTVWHTYEDLQTTRELLQKQAGNFANPQEQRAATVALKELTNYIDNIPQSALARGDAAAASARVAAARSDYAAGKTAERVADKIYNAEVQAGSTYSGGNVNNATRQKLRPLLTSPKQGRGLNEDELALVEDAVTGSTAGNVTRGVGKFLGGGGGMQMANMSALGGGIGALVGGGIPGALIGSAIPAAVGYGVKKIGDAITRQKADTIQQAILARSDLGQQMGANLNALLGAPPWLQRMLLSGLMARPQSPLQITVRPQDAMAVQ